MRMFHWLLVVFLVFPLNVFAKTVATSDSIIITDNNTLIKHFESSNKGLRPVGDFKRSSGFPTQVIRIAGDVSGFTTTCAKVMTDIEQFYIAAISDTREFSYSNFVLCHFDPKTGLASYFSIQGFFDPLNDHAVDYAVEWINSVNGLSFYGVPFVIESARELVVSLRVTSGFKQGPDDPNLVVFKTDTVNHYFTSHYEMEKVLVNDVNQRFNSIDPDVLLGFFEYWLYPDASLVYKQVLKKSNFVALEPERIFMMDDEPRIFSPRIQMNFTHACFQGGGRPCLN